MLFQSALSLALLLFSTTTTSVPVEAVPQGSKHNLYLVTCTKQPDCVISILCPRQVSKYTAVAYYANGPIESNRGTNPTAITTVSDPALPWEGTPRVATFSRVSVVTTYIDAGASTLASGQIAGSANATVDSENFACFRDGTSSIVVRGDLGSTQYSCTADYWCPSIQV